MKLSASTILWTFIWCLFMGVTAISIGFGALFPSMNLISKPFVCPGGEMSVFDQTYNPYPGKTITTLTWYCTDNQTGAKTELGIFPMSLYAGLIYGLALFVVVFIGMVISANMVASRRTNLGDFNVTVGREERSREQSEHFSGFVTSGNEDIAKLMNKVKASGNALARMKELKELRATNMISEAEYEKKRAEILKDL